MDTLTLAIEHALSQPPSRAGMRLRSEQDLAELLGAGRRQIRNSLDRLQSKGILVRKRGSGTYLRCVPGAGIIAPKELQIRTEHLLAREADEQVSAGPTFRQRQLHLALWSDLQLTTGVSQLMLAGMVRRADQLGHRLSLHSFLDRDRNPLDDDSLERMVARHRADGCIVALRWASRFMRAIDDESQRAIYYTIGSDPSEAEPSLLFDTVGSFVKAIHLLSRQGHRRIAFLGLCGEGHSGRDEREAYEMAMRTLDLPYRAGMVSTIARADIARQVHETFGRPDRPDAIYVSDDNLLPALVDGLARLNLRIGRDVALITLANRGMPLPPGHAWSCLEFNPTALGERLIDELLRWIQVGGAAPCSLAIGSSWIPGDTHFLQRGR